MSQNWRPETNAGDYFSHEQRRLDVADRRPVTTNPATLVGPGIAANTRRITNYNSETARFNGFFSSVSAVNGPRPNLGGLDTNRYVGYTVSDEERGGVQVLTDITTGFEYRRTFTRNLMNPNAITWGAWRSSEQPTLQGSGGVGLTNPPAGVYTTVFMPPNTTTGPTGFWSLPSPYDALQFHRRGLYTGSIHLFTNTVPSETTLVRLTHPQGTGTVNIEESVYPRSVTQHLVKIAFTFAKTTDATQDMTISVSPASTNAQFAVRSLQIARVADA